VRVSNPGKCKKFFSSPKHQDRLCSPRCFLFIGSCFFFCFCVIKWPRHDVGHLPVSRAEIKNEWKYTFAPVVCLSDVDIENFTFYNVTIIIVIVV
jgi:hypothetical protein